MFRKVSIAEQVRHEKANSLRRQNEQDKIEKMILEELVNINFSQSILNLGVDNI
jgi:hypothetical protein